MPRKFGSLTTMSENHRMVPQTKVDVEADAAIPSQPTRCKGKRTRDNTVMNWRQETREEEEGEVHAVSFGGGRSWRGQKMGTRTINNAHSSKRKKSCGISPKSFHKPTTTPTKSKFNSDSPYDHVREMLITVGRSVKYRGFAEKFKAFQTRNPLLEFPFQEPALQALDDLIVKHDEQRRGSGRIICENGTSEIEDLVKMNQLKMEKKTHGHDGEEQYKRDHHNGDATYNNQDENDPMWSEEPRIFAIEKSSTGKRRYVVATLGRFLHHYWRFCEPSSRHYYELIREKTPCRLYFDIEYNKKANPTITPDTNETLMDEFIAELIGEIQTVYDVSIDRTNIVDLDSSTSKKFSRHLIVHFPGGELFADAVSCGVFVKSFVGRLAEEEATGVLRDKRPVLAKHLFVYSTPMNDTSSETLTEAKCSHEHGTEPHATYGTTESEDAITQGIPPLTETSQQEQQRHNIHDKSCFIDTGVYTRNRLFRIMGSSKYGKASSAALRIAGANQFPFPEGFTNAKFYAPMMEEARALVRQQQEIVSNSRGGNETRDDCGRSHSCSIDTDDEQFNWKGHSIGLVQTLVTPTTQCYNNGSGSSRARLSASKILEVKDRGQAAGSVTERSSISISSRGSSRISRFRKPSASNLSYKYNCGPSSFPPLDDFVNRNLANRKGVNGAIRAWSVIKMNSASSDENDLSRDTIIYQIKDNRWCENIQRCHKSNNVMWHVALCDMNYWQTCWDPECRMMSFKGEVKELPQGIQDEIKNICIENSMKIDDDFEKALASMELPEGTGEMAVKHLEQLKSCHHKMTL